MYSPGIHAYFNKIPPGTQEYAPGCSIVTL